MDTGAFDTNNDAVSREGTGGRTESLRSLVCRTPKSGLDEGKNGGAFRSESKPFRILAATAAVFIVVLGVLDVISTNMVLAAGGREVNPIVAWTMERLDSWWHLPKIAVHLVAGLLIFYLMASRFTLALAFLLVLVYGLVVHHNFSLALSV